jgi:hypothetical protein
MAKSMIVKVQLAIVSSSEQQTMLVYNQGRAYMFEGPVTEDVKKLMGRRYKKYFHSHLDGEGCIVLDKEAPTQLW